MRREYEKFIIRDYRKILITKLDYKKPQSNKLPKNIIYSGCFVRNLECLDFSHIVK